LLLHCSTSGIHALAMPSPCPHHALALCDRRLAASMRPHCVLIATTDHRRRGAPRRKSAPGAQKPRAPLRRREVRKHQRQRRDSSQPRAAPWVAGSNRRKALKGRLKRLHIVHPIESPLQGSIKRLPHSPGRCPGLT